MDETNPPVLIDIMSADSLEKNEGYADYGNAGHDQEDKNSVHVMVNPDSVKDPVFIIYCKDPTFGGLSGMCAMLNFDSQEDAEAAYVEMHGEEGLGFAVETSVEDYRKLVEMSMRGKEAPAQGDYYAGEFQAGLGNPRKKRYNY